MYVAGKRNVNIFSTAIKIHENISNELNAQKKKNRSISKLKNTN